MSRKTGKAAKFALEPAVYESILASIRDPIVILDPDLRVLTVNDAFYKTFKVQPHETERRLIHELGNGQWKFPKLTELLLDILPRNSFFHDFEIIHDFEVIGRRTMLLSGRRMTGPATSPMILLSIEDITERLQYQAAVRASLLRYRRLFEAAQDGILVIDPVSRKIIDANSSMLGILGVASQEVVGKELWEIGLLADEKSSHGYFRQLQQDGSVKAGAVPLQTKTGKAVVLEMVSKLYEEAGDKVIQCQIRDITDHRRMEEKLRQSMEFNQAVMANMGEGLYALDGRGLVAYVNPAAERLFGWKSDELLGRRMHEITHYQHQDGTPFPVEDCPGLKVLREGKVLIGQQDVFIRRNGTFFDVVYSSSPILSGTNIDGLVVVFREVSKEERQ